MHAFVSALRVKVPPYTGAINLTDATWLRTSLTRILEEMVARPDLPWLPDPRQTELLNRIIDSIVMVVVNYRSISRPNGIGDRHTATYINPDRFKKRQVKRRLDLGDMREQNCVVVPPHRKAEERRRNEAVTDVWYERWYTYHRDKPKRVSLTLNDTLLNSSACARPQPVLVSWFQDAAPRRLAPAALNAPLAEMRSWSREHGAWDGEGTDIAAFATAFRAMLSEAEGAKVGDSDIKAMVGWLVTNFGDLGGDCFFSFPVAVRVHSDSVGAGSDQELRAVVSVSLSHHWDAELYDAAWQFFNGVANTVISDLMTSEYVAHARAKWELANGNSVYWASHALKHRLELLETLAGELAETLSATGDEPVNRARLASKAARLLHVSKTAARFVNYLNLLADLLDPGSEARIQRSYFENVGRPHAADRWIDLGRLLVRAASDAVDKGSHRRTVRLVGNHGGSIPIPRRLTELALGRHRDNEDGLVQLIFAELLQNAATSGLTLEGTDVGPVLVRIEVHKHARSVRIALENLIDPSSLPGARAAIARRMCEGGGQRVASGLTLAEGLLSQLWIGTLDCRIERANPQHWPLAKERELFVWRSFVTVVRR